MPKNQIEKTNEAEQASKSEVAYLRVKQDIVSGRISDDKPLRTETLKANYDLGVTPIRDALARLETEGFVELRHNRGYYTTRLSAEDFQDLLYTRFTIERELLKRSIERGGDDWEVEIVAAHHLLSKSTLELRNPDMGDLEQWEDRHVAFHTALLSASGASRFLAYYRGIYDHFRRHQKALVLLPFANRAQRGDAEALKVIDQLEQSMALEEHTRLMEAALSRDVVLAMRLMDEHAYLTPWQVHSPHLVGN